MLRWFQKKPQIPGLMKEEIFILNYVCRRPGAEYKRSGKVKQRGDAVLSGGILHNRIFSYVGHCGEWHFKRSQQKQKSIKWGGSYQTWEHFGQNPITQVLYQVIPFSNISVLWAPFFRILQVWKWKSIGFQKWISGEIFDNMEPYLNLNLYLTKSLWAPVLDDRMHGILQ